MQFLKLACVCMLAWCMVASMAHAQVQPVDSGGGGPVELPTDDNTAVMKDIRSMALQNAERLGLNTPDVSAPAGIISNVNRNNVGRFIFPLRLSTGSDNWRNFGISNYVDLNDAGPDQLLDFNCGARTYDLDTGYDHQGTDLFTWPFPKTRMANDEADVVAAADGTIVVKHDGEYDLQCGTAPSTAQPNYIAVQHADGLISYYLHFKKNSLTAKVVGDAVKAGEYLGQVGSSGFSTGPHLHFEIQDTNGQIVDPYAGSCGASTTLWKSQEAYRAPTMLRIGIHNAAPGNPSIGCGTETPNFARYFALGDTVTAAIYVRDQAAGQTARIALIRPDGTEYNAGTTGSPATGQDPYTVAWWYFSFPMPASGTTGVWKVRVDYAGRQFEEPFYVNMSQQGEAALVASALPGSRSVKSGNTATYLLTALNYSANDAYGCRITPDTQLAGDFNFQTTDPATNVLVGTQNHSADIAAGSSQSFLVAIDTNASGAADGQEIPLRVKCANAPAVDSISGVNTIFLSFENANVPDVIAVSLAPSNDGTLSIPGSGGANAFVVATANVGVADTLTIQARSDVPGLVMAICETNPTLGTCLASPSSSLDMTFGANGTNSFAVFVTATEAVPFDPGNSRIVVDITDAGGTLRGSTSVAVRTDG